MQRVCRQRLSKLEDRIGFGEGVRFITREFLLRLALVMHFSFRQSTLFADGSAADAYLVYDSVSDRQLNLFVTDGNGKNWSGTDTADLAQINVDARTALDSRLKEWR